MYWQSLCSLHRDIPGQVSGTWGRVVILLTIRKRRASCQKCIGGRRAQLRLVEESVGRGGGDMTLYGGWKTPGLLCCLGSSFNFSKQSA